MTQNNLTVPLPKRFFPGLLPIIGNDKYQKVKTKYEELYLNHELPENPYLCWHLTQGILPGLAYFQILRGSGESQEIALKKY